MDYSGFYEFPFPSVLSDDGIQAKNFFFALSDDEQLMLLNSSKSYENFQSRVLQRMNEV